jgi:predicted phage terminase large subunit-like protein
VTGDLLVKGGYELLCLPAEYEPERCCCTLIGWSDRREKPGDLLWPERVTAIHLEELKVSLGAYRYAGQYQQRPAPAGGGIFQRFWWRYWRPAHVELPPVQVRSADGEMLQVTAVSVPAQFDSLIQSWDMAFKDLPSCDYVVGQVWGALKADRFLLDQRRARMDLPATKEAVREMSRLWPKAATKLVEDKANGPAVIQELQHDISGLIEVNPEGGKVARAHSVSPQAEAGNIYLPHPAIAPWVAAFIEEAASFPQGRNDDQVDAMTQALNRLRNTGGTFTIPESQITVDPFLIPEEWPRVFGMAITRDLVAALWGAQDESGTIYLYAEHFFPHAEPSENARAIRAIGSWIPGVVNLSRVGGSQLEKEGIVQLYREHHLNVQAAMSGEEAGRFQFWHLLAANKLKVFASLSRFLAEYRIGDEESPLLQCCHTLTFAGRHRLQRKPVYEARDPEIPVYSYRGEGSWMTL